MHIPLLYSVKLRLVFVLFLLWLLMMISLHCLNTNYVENFVVTEATSLLAQNHLCLSLIARKFCYYGSMLPKFPTVNCTGLPVL